MLRLIGQCTFDNAYLVPPGWRTFADDLTLVVLGLHEASDAAQNHLSGKADGFVQRCNSGLFTV